jgi:transcription antitermination factor NusG
MGWFALYVKARHEFSTNAVLQKKGIETFLPVVKRCRQWRDRKKLIDFPLFPGYLFVHTFPNSEGFVNVFRTRGAVNLISTELSRPTPIPREEISSLRVLIESGKELDIYPYFKNGIRIRVRRGLLAGLERDL